MSSIIRKFVVVHSGNRDGYNLALSLTESDHLQFLVTDDFFFRKKSNRGKIASSFVAISKRALAIQLMTKLLPGFKFLTKKKDQFLSKKALKLAIAYNCNIFAYSYYANFAFKTAGNRTQKILFQVHPHPIMVKEIFEEEMLHLPVAKTSLLQEDELKNDLKLFNNLSEEAKLADTIICASTFTKKSLIFAGIKPAKIRVVPYGVDLQKFVYFNRQIKQDKNLKILFIGSINQRKGLYYLALAVKNLQEKGFNISLSVVGRGIVDREIIDVAGPKNVSVHINVDFRALLKIYHDSDIFVFPSLCEGFGHVILEAMATGLPVITTDHTAGPDVIEDGVDGFIIPIRRPDLIIEKIELLSHNNSLRQLMGIRAAEKARSFTWQNFRNNLNTALENNK